MMHARSIHSHKLRKIKTSMAYVVAYIHSLIYSITSRATRFAISVPTQEFYFSPTPQVYMQNVNLGSRLQSKYFHIYIPIYILLYQSYPKVNTSYIYI